MITIHKDAPPQVSDRYAEGWTCVGFTPTHLKLAQTETTCLKQICPPWVGFDLANMGMCRLPKGHDGDCADEVWYCDACDGVYSTEDETVERFGNDEATICGRCS